MNRLIGNLCLTAILITLTANFAGAFDVETFIANFENKNDQTALVSQIDSLTIIRGPAEFHLGQGELTLLDFGCGTPCAMVFKGKVHFIFSPPDEIERYQLNKFTGKDTLDSKFDNITFFYTVEMDYLPDTAMFRINKISKIAWDYIQEYKKQILDYMGFSIINRMLGDLLDDRAGSFFIADFRTDRSERMMFVEDPFNDDWFSLNKLRKESGSNTCDVYSGYSPDSGLPSLRNVAFIDIEHYNIESTISKAGDIISKCRVQYLPLKNQGKFIYFNWHQKNIPVSVLSSQGDSLFISNIKNEPGFAIILDNPMVPGIQDYLDIEFECRSMINDFGIYYFEANTHWYPKNPIWDRATFRLVYDYPNDYEVVSCGELKEVKSEGDRINTEWECQIPTEYIAFDFGIYESREVAKDYVPLTKTYLAKGIPHDDIADYYDSVYVELSSRGDMLGAVAKEVSSSLLFLTNLLGPCPFETIKAVEIPYSGGQGSPGLVHYSWFSYQFAGQYASNSQLRAHEISHQWWGHAIDYESYRDIWITEGLAEYSGFLYYQVVAVNSKLWQSQLKDWNNDIIDGYRGKSIGSKAGPIVLGARLNSELSEDYNTIVYEKGAYIFHMLRYLMFDYKTNSDAFFKMYLKDLLKEFKDNPITTATLRVHLEQFAQTEMTWFFDQWVYGIYIPTYTFSYDTEKTPDGQFQVTCHIKQEDVPDDFKMVVPMTVVFEGDQFTHLKYWIDQPQMDIQLPPLPMKPKKIDFNTYDAVLCKVKTK